MSNMEFEISNPLSAILFSSSSASSVSSAVNFNPRLSNERRNEE
jgi:hypothetical protein